MAPSPTSATSAIWRTPLVILLCGCMIGVLGFGPRSSFGLFLTPMSTANGWGRDVFALAVAIQMLLWGAGQPFAGAVADRFGAFRVLAVGSLLYAAGLALMAYATTAGAFYLSVGVVIGVGLSGSSFTIVIGAFGKLMPREWRSLAFGAGTAAGSFGQFLFSPIAIGLIHGFGWHRALLIFSGVVLLMIPLALAFASPGGEDKHAGAGTAAHQSGGEAIKEALGHRSYVLLIMGYFTCGFQLFFITVHLPAYLVDRGLSADIGAWTLGTIGLFNIIGSVSSGWLSDRMPKRYVLSAIYFTRSLVVLAFTSFPVTPTSSIAFGAVMGLLWLSTVPPTTGIIAVMFGTRWLTMLAGAAFFSHQVGGFLGVWLGGLLFDYTGSYDVVWWLSIFFGVMSAVINLPIDERPVARPALATTPA